MKTTQEKIQSFIFEEWSDSVDANNVEQVSMDLESESLINFSIIECQNQSDSWFQVEYYSKRIAKAIIWNADFDIQKIEYNSKDFAQILIETETKIQAFEDKLSDLQNLQACQVPTCGDRATVHLCETCYKYKD